ncbi:ABC transporter ATP-binding protein [Amycolatopsis saalfeldensis]|uniref:NitT/TauT family transport system ATP-binding protein n=1 Tax=Amycolatopsis saalfeldensis TaxID=394193 RepID=A0A1H8YCE8_9PSEU|nr:ABC transporter ATP-binding protein [Amycolatopsis saalfeldensis]SEP49673.1 NitT/TauT family transport system ATP-binding protein [Amycolatopsis saalfeldensis]
MAPPLIELIGATKRFPSGSGSVHTAVRELSMTVDPGEFVAVVGPTGCGKSTTLSLVSGLQPASAGQVRVNGDEVTAIPDGVGYMFQTDAVMPWRSVLDNVASGPRFRGESKADARAKAADWIGRVGLAGFEKYYPHQLSGGMRKRVALAQTLVTDPKILLMDEPFSALDVQTRALMQDELLRLWSGSGAAVIFVTHDLDEAIALADKVVVLTTSPATVKDVFEVPLERPRKVEDLRLTEEFRKIYSDIWESLRGEVDKARQKGATSVA